MLQVRGRHFASGRPIEVDFESDRIAAMRFVEETSDQKSWPWVAPGFFDLQVNGF